LEDQLLSPQEQDLIERLPKPPRSCSVLTTNVWIIEWLPESEQRTGLELFEYLERTRPGWARYIRCASKAEVLEAIARCTKIAAMSEMRPVLHVEAHGNEEGLSGPDYDGQPTDLLWRELLSPLQELNLATRCNLIVFMAACTGVAAIQVFQAGPRAPAVALVGPEDELSPSDVRNAAIEFYRRLSQPEAVLHEMVENSSRESRGAGFDWEPFIDIVYETFAEILVASGRPERITERNQIFLNRLKAQGVQEDEAQSRLRALPALLREQMQRMWDEMFMIDIYPENRKRFGLDVPAMLEMIDQFFKVKDTSDVQLNPKPD
jgi:hypothetical protein